MDIPTEDQWITIQTLLNAIDSLPGVRERVEAYMLGRGFDTPSDDIQEIHKIAF